MSGCLFTDAHCAKKDNGDRRCSVSMDKLRKMIAETSTCFYYIQLGDLINGSGNPTEDAATFRAAQELFAASGKPLYSVPGNHDCFALPKSLLFPDGIPESFTEDETNFVVIDACYFGNGKAYNGCEGDWTDSFIPPDRLLALQRQLTRPSIVLCHQRLDCDGSPLAVNNCAEVRELLERSGYVSLVLQGHHHNGDSRRINGIDYLTLPALCTNENNYYKIIQQGVIK